MKKQNLNHCPEKLKCWKILRKYFDRYFKVGLCDLVVFIEEQMDALDDYESEYLLAEIEEYHSVNNHKSSGMFYIWKQKDRRPRKRFINQKIKYYAKY